MRLLFMGIFFTHLAVSSYAGNPYMDENECCYDPYQCVSYQCCCNRWSEKAECCNCCTIGSGEASFTEFSCCSRAEGKNSYLCCSHCVVVSGDNSEARCACCGLVSGQGSLTTCFCTKVETDRVYNSNFCLLIRDQRAYFCGICHVYDVQIKPSGDVQNGPQDQEMEELPLIPKYARSTDLVPAVLIDK